MIKLTTHMEAMYSLELGDFEEGGVSRQVQPRNTYLFMYVHCLPSFFKLVEFMVSHHGFKACNIYILPKRYSRIQSTVDNLKKLGVNIIESEFNFQIGKFDEVAKKEITEACKTVSAKLSRKASIGKERNRLILVDDGGQLTREWQEVVERKQAFDIVSIQQTASGMFERPIHFGVPEINMAQSAAKRWFESKIIATGVTQKVSDLDRDYSENLLNRRVGVAGFGAVGRSLAKNLVSLGYDVAVLEPLTLPEIAEWNLSHYTDQCKFLDDVETVFGCVGRDWMDIDSIKCVSRKMRFFSCSSRDIEFKTLLNTFDMDCIDAPFGTARINGLHESLIFNGGFPINFDRTKEYESLNEIIITRALILASILQAMHVDGHYVDEAIKLSVSAQKNIVEKWLIENDAWETMPENYGVSFEDFENDSWWDRESKGRRLSEFGRLEAEKGHIMY